MGLADSKHGHLSRKSGPAFIFDAKTSQVDMILRNSFKGPRVEKTLSRDLDTNHNQLHNTRPATSVSKPWAASCLGNIPGHPEAGLLEQSLVTCWNWPQGQKSIGPIAQIQKEALVKPFPIEEIEEKEKWTMKSEKKFSEDEGIYDTLEPGPISFCPTCNGVYCNYTCHLRCRPLVSLDCIAQTTDLSHQSPDSAAASQFDDFGDWSPLLEEVIEKQDCEVSEFPKTTFADLSRQIQTYNASVVGSEITLLEDGQTFSGFLRVHMKLCRPINVVSTLRPLSIYDVLNEDDCSNEKTLTSFYLPRDTVKALHVTSETTTQEVITSLLKKFKVVDNPHKFALYERDYEIGDSTRVRMRRIHDTEQPLRLVLMWFSQGHVGRHLVLQENDTGDIPWDAFSLPELSNFLRILEREEDEYLQQVRLKYTLMAEKIKEALQEREDLVETSQHLPDTAAPIPPPRRRHSEVYSQSSTLQAGASLDYDSLPNLSTAYQNYARNGNAMIKPMESANMYSNGKKR